MPDGSTTKQPDQMILLAIEDVTEREYYKRHLEELVEQRTAELRIAKEALSKIWQKTPLPKSSS
jgi:hypothetical protein